MTYDGNCRLGDLFESRRERGRQDLPLLSVTMSDGLVNREDLERKQDTTLSPEEHLLVKSGDIAYNMMRMWQGAFGLADREGMVSPAYVVLKPKDGLDPAYAAQLLRTPRMLYLMWAYSYGLTDDRLRLYFPDFSAIKATVPTKKAQSRIAKLLGTWDEAIGVTKRLAENAEKQRRVLLHELVGERGKRKPPSGNLRIARLGDLIGELQSGVSVNGMDRAAEPGEAGILKISAVTAGVFEPQENKAIKPDEISRAKVKPRADRVIVSRCNTAELLGASAYVETDYPDLYLPDKLWQLEPKSPNAVHMRWLASWLASKSTRTTISSLATGSSGSMKNIAKKQLLRLPIAVPPYEEQVRIANTLIGWDDAAKNLRRQVETLLQEKTALMHQLLIGKHRVRPYDAKAAP